MTTLQEVDLLGLTLKQATKLAEERGYIVRIRKLEGVPQEGFCDRRTNRWNFHIEEGKVVKAYID